MENENNKEIIEEKKDLKDEQIGEEEKVETPVEESSRVVEETPLNFDDSITNTTAFTKEGYIRMNSVLAKRSYILIAIFEIILAAISVYFFVVKEWLIGGGLAALVILYPILIKVLAKNQLNRTFKTYDNAFSDSTYVYYFGKDAIDLDFKHGESISKGNIPYTSIYQVIEDIDYIFIFIAQNQAYIVEKKGFNNPSDSNEILRIMKEKGVKVKLKKQKEIK